LKRWRRRRIWRCAAIKEGGEWGEKEAVDAIVQ
jgi:hypothetical protein